MEWGGPGPGSALLSGVTRLLLGLPTCHWTPRLRDPASARRFTLCPGTNPTPHSTSPTLLCPCPRPWGVLAQAALLRPFFPCPSSLPFPWPCGQETVGRGAGRLEVPARPFPFAGPPQGLGQLKPPEEEASNQELAGWLGLTRS